MIASLIRRLALPALLAACGTTAAHAEASAFDLAGPVLRVTVSHGGATLPIARVPQLADGDRIEVRADLPADQSAHYLLIAAFLRGATNPPPDKWFAQAETWTKKGRRGLSLTVPPGAQQVALFLAPATGGDFSTLRNSVQGRPGAFVRAAQELAQASLDRRRLDAYLAAVRRTVPGDPDRLTRITPLLSRSLQVKINPDCLAKLPDLQAACLLQNQENLVLSDGHSNAITDALAGPGSDLALQLSATPQGGLGYYSPYIAAIRDVIGIFASIRTAKYQYIPALAAPDGDRMALVLNAPPSFHNPKSVLVTALPIVAPVHVPPLQLPAGAPALCGSATDPLLPIVGAPLVYATDYAHDLALRVTLPDGRRIELPATPDVERGGLVVHVAGRLPAGGAAPLASTLHGLWGFQPFDGPTVTIAPARAGGWHVDGGAADGGTVTLTGGSSACVAGVAVRSGDAAAQAARWTTVRPDAIAVTLPAGDRGSTRTIELSGPAGVAPTQIALAPPPRAPAPIAATIARDVRRPAQTGLPVMLDGDRDVPADATLTVSFRAGDGQRFGGRETIEVSAESGGDAATLATGKGLALADPHVMVATIAPGAALGPAAFGPMRARIVRDGVAGDWLPIGTLVRLPQLAGLQCPVDAAAPCRLSGERLFLVAAISAATSFERAAPVPDGFPGAAIDVPHPVGGTLFLRLRDDPDAVARVAVPQ